jgi:hypothetical protein
MSMVKGHDKGKAPLRVLSSTDIGKSAHGVFKTGDQYKRNII